MACLNFYTIRQWRFISDNAITLLSSMSAEDRRIFYFDVREINWRQYITNYVAGTKKYILKDYSTPEEARIIINRFSQSFCSNWTYCLFTDSCLCFTKGSIGYKRQLMRSFCSSRSSSACACSVGYLAAHCWLRSRSLISFIAFLQPPRSRWITIQLSFISTIFCLVIITLFTHSIEM